MFESVTGRKRLLKTHESVQLIDFSDLLHACAITVEEALLTSGATPKIDYTVIDVFKLAMPLAINRQTESTSICVGIPSDHPNAGLEAEPTDTEAAVLSYIEQKRHVTKPHLSLWAGKNGIPMKEAQSAASSLLERGVIGSFKEGQTIYFMSNS